MKMAMVKRKNRRAANRSRPLGKKSRDAAVAPTPNVAVPEEFLDSSRGVRLQKVLAGAGVASRRGCEQMVLEGRVSVNGRLIGGLPAWVNPKVDRVTVDGRDLRQPAAKGRREQAVYVVLHKPRRVISTTSDPEGRKCLIDLLPEELVGEGKRLFPVGRLDADSTGLILLTNDGELANKLAHPRYGVSKEYLVTVRGKISREDIDRMNQGVFLTAKPSGVGSGQRIVKTAMENVQLIDYQLDRLRGDRTKLKIVLNEGRNREIRRVLAKLGFNVRKLRRIGIGPVRLGDMKSGQVRVLSVKEVQLLHQAAKGV